MTDRPILFSGPMIRALLEGRKTQTRRVFKGIEADGNGTFHVFNRRGGLIGVSEADVPTEAPDYVPYAAGDHLWVREAWRTPESLDDLSPRQIELRCKELGYHGPWCPRVTVADEVAHQWSEEDGFREDQPSGRLRAAMHMPRWASRLTLIVTDVRVQRLQEITWQDARAEGISGGYHQSEFASLWDDLNASRGFGWDANPWVVALTFEVIRQNIDAMGEAA
ncbi:MAG: hypothetical protein ABL311_04430 [Nitratireductor rhodophyticola]|uniref:hypothetical protein n=1 Tax=Nitratireductor rhodophyticola TaxID=2854036 RepID=UPI0032D92D65